jgi:hypothetical protein
MRASAVAVVLLGCGGGTRPSAAPEASLAGAGGRPGSVPTAAAVVNRKPTLASVRLEVDSAPSAGGASATATRVRVEFMAPVFGETLAELGLRKQEVRLGIEPAPLPADRRLLISFDGLRPRAVTGDVISLGELIPEDHAVRAGVHSLLAVVTDPEWRVAPICPVAGQQRPQNCSAFAVTDFFVGARQGALPRPNDPRLFCLSPTGTYHGAASDRPLLQLFAVGGVERSVPLSIEARSGVFAALIEPALPYRVLGLPAGDVTFRAGAASGPRAECVVTLNPERREGS